MYEIVTQLPFKKCKESRLFFDEMSSKKRPHLKDIFWRALLHKAQLKWKKFANGLRNLSHYRPKTLENVQILWIKKQTKIFCFKLLIPENTKQKKLFFTNHLQLMLLYKEWHFRAKHFIGKIGCCINKPFFVF